MTLPFQIICALLILCCLAGIFALFLSHEYIRKISCLSISYTSFIALIAVIALRNPKQNEAMLILVSVLVVMAVNLLIGIGLAKNIASERRRIAESSGNSVKEFAAD